MISGTLDFRCLRHFGGGLLTVPLMVAALLSFTTARANAATDVICYLDANPGLAGGVHDGKELSPPMVNCPTEKLMNGASAEFPTNGGDFVPADKCDYVQDPAAAGLTLVPADQPCYKASRIRVTDVPPWTNPSFPSNKLLGNWIYNFDTLSYIDYSIYAGVRLSAIPKGTRTTTPIDAHHICRYVDNYTGQDIFIPLKTEKEWQAFIDHAPNDVEITKCSLPCGGSCTSHRILYGPSEPHAMYYPTELPYARTGQKFPNAPQAQIDSLAFSHTFNEWCDYKVAGPEVCCWMTDGPPDENGNPTSECGAYGHHCDDKTAHWVEVYDFHAIAGASQDTGDAGTGKSRDNGWGQGVSNMVGGVIPVELCALTCADTCSSPPTPPPPPRPPTPPGRGGGDGAGGGGGTKPPTQPPPPPPPPKPPPPSPCGGGGF